jgi:hypothetical protein
MKRLALILLLFTYGCSWPREGDSDGTLAWHTRVGEFGCVDDPSGEGPDYCGIRGPNDEGDWMTFGNIEEGQR